ncbi:hypothetical protein [Runella sp.]|uniref:hypothetical protein n=1 Tax=Runella sp. TaxID=1960881 RepID=UPI003D0C902F
MKKIIAAKSTKIYDSLTNKVVLTVKQGDPLGYPAEAQLKRKVGAVTRTVTEVWEWELVKGQHQQHFYWFIPNDK